MVSAEYLPMQNENSTSATEETKKKEQRRNNSVESFVREDRSPNWDSETDHLLSYFLGGENQQSGVISPPTQFASSSAWSSGDDRNFPFSGARLQQASRSGSSENFSSSQFDDDPVPPPTPATQYYHYASSTKGRGMGRPPGPSSMLTMQQSRKVQNNSHMNMKSAVSGGSHAGASSSKPTIDPQVGGMSPISPATMFGPVQEQLMLPPPSRGRGNDGSTTVESSQPLRQSHLDWLQHINTLAQQASATPANSAPTPVHSSQSQVQQIPPVSSIPYATVPGMPTMQGNFAQAPMFYTQAALKHLQQQAPMPESEEKRAKRLERNRESARKSRLRKKLRLSQVEEKVANLHTKIEVVRKEQINQMNERMQEYFLQRMMQVAAEDGDDAAGRDQIRSILHGAGPNTEVKRAVIDFQCSLLRQTLLPRYQQFLLWTTLHPESWFMAGKEHHAKGDNGKPAARVTSGKISSKQVGETLSNARSSDEGEDSGDGEKQGLSAKGDDPLRMWPLLCFELSISVDQEERFINQGYKGAKKREDLPHLRSQIEAAARMATGLNEAVLLQSHNAAVRANRTYLDILTPQQTVAYHKWLANNRERNRDTISNLRNQRKNAEAADTNAENATLIDVCRKLEQVLKISKGGTDDKE